MNRSHFPTVAIRSALPADTRNLVYCGFLVSCPDLPIP